MKNKTLSGNLIRIALHAASAMIMLICLMLMITPHTFADSGITGTAKVSADNGAYLRKSATTLSGQLGLLPCNSDLVICKEVFKSKTDTGNDQVWYYVKAGNKKGYVRSDLVSNVNYATVEGVLKNTANYRTGPGVRMNKAGTLRKNSKVTICLDASPAKGTEGSNSIWYKIKVNGKFFYVCSGNVRITGNIKTVKAAPAATQKPASTVQTQTQPQTQEQAQPQVQTVQAVYDENAVSFDKVKAATASSTPVKGVVVHDTISVMKDAKSGSELTAELNQNALVTVRSAMTAQEQVDDGCQITVQWYEIEFDKSQVIEIGDPEDESNGAAPAYLAEDQSSDRELEAENASAERELAGSDEDSDDNESEDSATDEGSYTGRITDGAADANGIIRGYVRAEDISAYLAK